MEVDPVAKPLNSERVLLEEGGVLISTTRLVFGDHTYATGQVTSTRFATIPGVDRDWRGWLQLGACSFALGSLLVLVGFGLWKAEGDIGMPPIVLGAIAIVAAPAMLARAWQLRGQLRHPPEFVVIVVTSGGEIQALRSPDRSFIQRVVNAVSEALVERG